MVTLEPWWRAVGTAFAIAFAVLASGHVVLHKRDVRSAIGWVGLIWLVPWGGAALYLLLGINRIRRRAVSLRKESRRYRPELPLDTPALYTERERISTICLHLSDLSVAIGTVSGRRLLPGNRLKPLFDGDAAYPAMLEAIEQAQRSISLATYIFETTGIGARFVDALARARARGVEVRVLIDDIGARYASPRADRVLKKARRARGAVHAGALAVARAVFQLAQSP